MSIDFGLTLYTYVALILVYVYSTISSFSMGTNSHKVLFYLKFSCKSKIIFISAENDSVK